MTTQNNPPNLDICEEETDQYKNYSKVFRHFIEQCLTKNPVDRPSAKQLLQHEFLEKAKVKIDFNTLNISCSFKKFQEKLFVAKYLALPYELRRLEIKERLNVISSNPYSRWIKADDGKWGCALTDTNNSTNAPTSPTGDALQRQVVPPKSCTQPIHLCLKMRFVMF